MATKLASYDFTRMKRLIIIYRISQLLLLAILVYMAFTINKGFFSIGAAVLFTKTIIFAVIIQTVFFYPAMLLAKQELSVSLDSALNGVTDDDLKAIRKRRLMGDIWKMSFIGFSVIFIMMLPGADKGIGARVLLSSSLLGFLLVLITYFQCFNFMASRKMKELGR